MIFLISLIFNTNNEISFFAHYFSKKRIRAEASVSYEDVARSKVIKVLE